MRWRQLARSERFELPTLGFEVRCSIQLSYERVCRTLAREAAKASPEPDAAAFFRDFSTGWDFSAEFPRAQGALVRLGNQPPPDLLRWVIIKSFWRKQ
jgi:hypothetical protein